METEENYVHFVGLIAFLIGIVALLVASRRQRVVSQPLEHLTQTVQTISASKDDNVCATQESADEVGTLPLAEEIPLDLLALTSLDTREGIHRIGGRADAYRKQLGRFREHYSNAIMELQRLIAEKNIQAVENYCHALKGVSGNISANALYKSVAAMDALLKQGIIPEPSELENLSQLLRQVIDEIDGIAPAVAATPVVVRAALTRDEALAKIARLAATLNNDLGVAESVLSELRAGVAGSESEQAVNEIAARMDVFAIDEARALLDELSNRLQAA